MSAYQFPPSSPLIGERDHRSDPFATKGKSTKVLLPSQNPDEYPTPNPSSSIGRSSSPVRERNNSDAVKPLKRVGFVLPKTNDAESKQASRLDNGNSSKSKSSVNIISKVNLDLNRSVRINSDFNILDPDSNVLRVPLNNNRTILVGRSSKSCDYHFKTSDKTISRTHLAITADSESNTIKIECLGFSGFGMRIPKPCLVYGSDTSNDYVLMISEGNPLRFNDIHQLGLKVTPRTINLDSNHTEFFVNRSERVTVPRVNNIFIQVRDNILLINPLEDEEEVTDDEYPVLIEKSDLEAQPAPEAPEAQRSLNPEIPQTVSLVQNQPRESQESRIALVRSTPSPVPLESTPRKQFYSSTPTTPLKSKVNHKKAASEEPTPTISFNAHHTNISDVESTPNRKVLGDITNLKRSHDGTGKGNIKKKKIQMFQQHEQQQQQGQQDQTRSVIDTKEPQHYSKSSTPELVSLESIPQLSEVNNVLLNHLAFSRLSSTPASFLNTISVLTSGLSLAQIRAVLQNLKSIGVIYREGKDAAGKPLEEEYYYIAEEDDNDERKKLVASIKGHGGLRSCRRTHKQYYWKKPAPKKK